MQGTYDTAVTLTNLSPSTNYDFRVRTDCGDTVSTWVDLSFTTLQKPATLPYNCDFNNPAENAQWLFTTTCGTAVVSFTTACGTLPLPYLQNFDSTEPFTIPNCWGRINPYAGHPQVNAGYAHSANNSLKFMCNPNGNAPVYAVLPEFGSDLSELQINFWTRRESANSGTLSVGYVTDPASAATFVPLMSVSSAQIGDDDYHNYLVKFDSVATDDTLHYYITFKYGQNTSWYWFVDDIQVMVIPPCLEPGSLTAANITSSSVDLSWTDVANSYSVFYRAEGDSAYTELFGVTLTGGVYTLSGLSAGRASA